MSDGSKVPSTDRLNGPLADWIRAAVAKENPMMSLDLLEVACREYFRDDYVAPDDPQDHPMAAACTAFRVGWRYCAGWLPSEERLDESTDDASPCPVPAQAGDDEFPCQTCGIGWVDDATGACDEPGCPGASANGI